MASGAASEFGGRQKRNGVQPLPHRPTPSEQLRLVYTTGDPTGATGVDLEGVVFTGLNPRSVQEEIRRQAGDLDKGQVWDDMVQEAGAE